MSGGVVVSRLFGVSLFWMARKKILPVAHLAAISVENEPGLQQHNDNYNGPNTFIDGGLTVRQSVLQPPPLMLLLPLMRPDRHTAPVHGSAQVRR